MTKAIRNSVATNNTLVKPKPSEMCPPGYHVVKGHERVCKSGTVTWVDAHIRKNRGKIRPGLLKENIHFLFWSSKKKYLTLEEIKGFEGNGAEYDELIQFWLDYWKSQGIEFPDKLDPVISIALGTRLLGHKYSQLRNSKKKTLRQLIRNYHSRDEEGDAYAEKVLLLYEKSRKKK